MTTNHRAGAAWIKPTVRKIRAGDAENRANATRFDAPTGFSSGS